jgi:hypothetical protein
MLKHVVWFCIASVNLACAGAIVIACTIVPESGRADMIISVLTILAGFNGGELIASAGVRLWGKDEKKEGDT